MMAKIRQMTEMEDRVRRAIYAVDYGMVDFDNAHPLAQADALKRAKAAIRAMREPTEEMMKAWELIGEECWASGIDAASPAQQS